MNKNSVLILVLLFIFCLFFFKISSVLDPDFGWHFKLGERIVTSGIPHTDPFSYTMPGYHLIEHAWLSDVGIYFLYTSFGLLGTALFFTCIAFIPFLFQAFCYRKEFAESLLLLESLIIADFIGIRPQVFTITFFSMMVLLITRQTLWKKYRYCIPFLIVLWANIHGGFAVGLFTILIFIMIHSLEQKRIDKSDFFIAVGSILASCINPYGIFIWKEVFTTVFSLNLHTTIQEWLPAYYFINICFLMFLAFSLMLVVRFRKNIALSLIALYVILLTAGFSSSRHIPLFLLLAFPVTIVAVKEFLTTIKKRNDVLKRFRKAQIVFFFICITACILQLIVEFYNPDSFLNEKSFYPKQAVLFLKTHTFSGHLLSSYDWGGYLIWKLPNEKVFVAGDMPTWHQNTAPSNESPDAFSDFQKIFQNSETVKNTLQKYHITMLLLSVDPPRKRESISRMMKHAGMKKIYQDLVSVIYQKP